MLGQIQSFRNQETQGTGTVRACQAAILSFLWQQLLTCLRDVGEDDAVEALKAHYLVGVDCEVQAP